MDNKNNGSEMSDEFIEKVGRSLDILADKYDEEERINNDNSDKKDNDEIPTLMDVVGVNIPKKDDDNIPILTDAVGVNKSEIDDVDFLKNNLSDFNLSEKSNDDNSEKKNDEIDIRNNESVIEIAKTYKSRDKDHQERMEKLRDFSDFENNVNSLKEKDGDFSVHDDFRAVTVGEDLSYSQGINVSEKEQVVSSGVENAKEEKVREKTEDKVEEKLEEDKKNNEKTEKVKDSEEGIKKINNKLSGFSLSYDDLLKIDGFSDLSLGKKLMLVENFKQLVLGRIQDEARDAYDENLKEKSWLGKIWQKASAAYQIRKLERMKAVEIRHGGIDIHKDILEELVRGAKISPDVEVLENGDFEVLYAEYLEDMTKSDRVIVDKFNKIANRFGRIPDDWKHNKNKKQQYESVENEYKEALSSLLALRAKFFGEKDSLVYINKLNGSVRVNQFLTSHPDVDSALLDIRDNTMWQSAVFNVFTERGIYVGLGALTRTLSASFLGALGAPLAASFLGGLKAVDRAKKSIEERKERLRKGGVSDDKKSEWANRIKGETSKQDIEKLNKERYLEGGGVVDADKLLSSARYLAEKINRTDDEIWEVIKDRRSIKNIKDITDDEKRSLIQKERERLVESLKVRSYYIKRKIDEGRVNYGKDPKERLSNIYDLSLVLGNMGASIEVSKNNDELLKRLNKYLSFKDMKISEAQSDYIKKEVIKGVFLGASFAVAGRVLADVFLGDSADTARKESVYQGDSVVSDKDIIDLDNFEDNSERAKGFGKGEGGVLECSDSMVQDATNMAEARGVEDVSSLVYEVKKGDSLWKIIEKKLEEDGVLDGLSKEKRTYVIDFMKDKFADMDKETLKEIGISSGDIDRLKVGDSIDLSSVFDFQNENINKALLKVEKLSSEDLENIKNNNEKILQWRKEHPNELLTSEKVDEILSQKSELKSEDISEDKKSEINNEKTDDKNNKDVGKEKVVSDVSNKLNISSSEAEIICPEITPKRINEVFSGFNTDLYDSVSATVNKKGDTIFSFDVKDNGQDIKLIITKDGKMAVDGYGKNNWPEGVKLGFLFFSRDESTFADLNDESLKEAMKIINSGYPMGVGEISINDIINRRYDEDLDDILNNKK